MQQNPSNQQPNPGGQQQPQQAYAQQPQQQPQQAYGQQPQQQYQPQQQPQQAYGQQPQQQYQQPQQQYQQPQQQYQQPQQQYQQPQQQYQQPQQQYQQPQQQPQQAYGQQPRQQYQQPQQAYPQQYQQPYMQAPTFRLPGKTLLMVVGILFIVLSSIALILYLMALALDSASGGVLSEVSSLLGFSYTLIFVTLALISAFQIVAAIIALINGNKRDKAQILLVIGVVLCVLPFFGILVSGFEILSLTAFILPILYVVGALLNKKAR